MVYCNVSIDATYRIAGMRSKFYDIVPVAKPRMTRRDKWAKRPCVLKYWAYKAECKLRGVTIESGDTVIFYIPMPKSWSKKKKEKFHCQPHRQKPDIDNLLKGIMDAVLVEDSHIHDIRAKKWWGYTGKIYIN